MTEKSMDLASLDTRKGAEQGFELQLTHPTTGAPLPGKITVLGQDSAAWQDKLNEGVKRRVKRLERNRKNLLTMEELEAESVEQLAAVTTGWTGLAFGGQEFKFSAENALKLYRDYPWIREQVYEAVNDRGNFLPRSASS